MKKTFLVVIEDDEGWRDVKEVTSYDIRTALRNESVFTTIVTHLVDEDGN